MASHFHCFTYFCRTFNFYFQRRYKLDGLSQLNLILFATGLAILASALQMIDWPITPLFTYFAAVASAFFFQALIARQF
jgi:hypothetical protein